MNRKFLTSNLKYLENIWQYNFEMRQPCCVEPRLQNGKIQ